jgi:hypothetical protein
MHPEISKALNKIGPDEPANTSLIEQKLLKYENALKQISNFHYQIDCEDIFNKCGEANYFNQVREIARKALGEN